jgi:SAM-dependent methyltransferase
VTAVDISPYALANARAAFPDEAVAWIQQDATTMTLPAANYDLVVAYGLLHCLPAEEIGPLVEKVKAATAPGGLNILVTFNQRRQDLSAHPGFRPTLLSHSFFLELYESWRILYATDEDLHETHPHNMIPHTHSMTRLIARAEADESASTG